MDDSPKEENLKVAVTSVDGYFHRLFNNEILRLEFQDRFPRKRVPYENESEKKCPNRWRNVLQEEFYY